MKSKTYDYLSFILTVISIFIVGTIVGFGIESVAEPQVNCIVKELEKISDNEFHFAVNCFNK